MPSPAVLSYGTVAAGNIYFQSRLYTSAWDNAAADDKQKALNSADDIIDQYAYLGQRTVADQPREWPRRDILIQGGWTISFPSDVLQMGQGIPVYPGLPDEILKAEFEIALALLDGVDPEAEARNRGVTSRSYASVRTTYDSSAVPEHILAGCPSAKAWTFLKPFLSPDNASGITLRRVN